MDMDQWLAALHLVTDTDFPAQANAGINAVFLALTATAQIDNSHADRIAIDGMQDAVAWRF
jgi:hypothetical protein